MRPFTGALRGALVAAAMAAAVAVSAAEAAQARVAVGEAPPSGFTLENLDGEAVSLEAARGEHPVLLVFFRGTW
jgi:cytochrome oxidase Cu insertion factor (SCO1/SenC/PrrC family)